MVGTDTGGVSLAGAAVDRTDGFRLAGSWGGASSAVGVVATAAVSLST